MQRRNQPGHPYNIWYSPWRVARAARADFACWESRNLITQGTALQIGRGLFIHITNKARRGDDVNSKGICSTKSAQVGSLRYGNVIRFSRITKSDSVTPFIRFTRARAFSVDFMRPLPPTSSRCSYNTRHREKQKTGSQCISFIPTKTKLFCKSATHSHRFTYKHLQYFDAE
jgi:hypothetical protein